MPDSTAPYPHPSLPDAAAMRAGAVLSIDLGAIQANWRSLQARLGAATCAAVMKADAYGLGAAQVGPALAAAGCTHFFVAHLAEGIALRPHLPEGALIHVLHGCFAGTEAECAAHGLIPVLNSPSQLAAWAALGIARGKRLPALIQLDTGMARFGFSEAELRQVVADGRALAAIELRAVMSHLACADEAAHPANAAQRARFDALRALLPAAPASLAASSGIFLGPDFHYQLARPGVALYGVNPTPGQLNPMQPVVRLDARVIQLRDVPAGTPVGYGHTARTAGPARLATIAVGYADGYLRAGSNKGAAWFAGIPLPLLGRVSMDSIILDASALPEGALHEGALVSLIGPERDVDAVGADAGTIGYEILTSLGARYHRRYLPPEA
ncbi:alanine racemase [Rhodovarius crocodyli]|uniref:Alanine racemase n=1 Tax=Rhodovarius crocodyli TaxID=1979269 RepID=A0A437LW72_9PROT|nr:alanine racemase [Rhodovarius crocodyli]RVT89651.1 alanine racemase [Rhodovarius crocodyli]